MPKQRGRSMDRSRSQPRITNEPIRPLSPLRKKPQQMIPEGDLSSKRWHADRNEFLDHTLSDLAATWPDDSMVWANLHVSGYYHSCGGLTHPRQLAVCSLRSNSREASQAASFFPASAFGGLTLTSVITDGKFMPSSVTGMAARSGIPLHLLA